MLGGIAVAVAIALVVHAGFSAVHWESQLVARYGDVGTISVPVDVSGVHDWLASLCQGSRLDSHDVFAQVWVEVVVAVALGLFASVWGAPSFKNIYSLGDSAK